MLSDKDRMAVLEMWSQLRPDRTEEDAYPQILNLIEATILLKLSAPRDRQGGPFPVERNRIPAGSTNGG